MRKVSSNMLNIFNDVNHSFTPPPSEGGGGGNEISKNFVKGGGGWIFEKSKGET